MRIYGKWLVLVAFLLNLSGFQAMSQCMYLVTVSGDTLIAGEANQVVVIDSGNFSQDNLGAFICAQTGYDFPPCDQCFYDTLKATSAVTDGFYTTIKFDLPYGTYPNRYIIHVYDTLNYSFCGEIDRIWVVSKPYVFTPPVDQTACYGEDITLEVIAYESESILYQWYHDGQILEGESGSSLDLENVMLGDGGAYTCILKNEWGEVSTTAEVTVSPYNDDVGTPDGPVLLCSGTAESSYSLPEEPLIDQYSWVLLPEEAGNLNQAGRRVSVIWEPEFYGEARLFAEITSGECATPNSDTLNIMVLGQAEAPEICIVGIDEITGKFRIVWNKIPDRKVSAYHIFRESNQAGVFLELATMGPDEFSVFVDSTSLPEALPHSYRLSYTDSCGNESVLSPVHTTIHLNANLGIGGENNLSWTHYQGFPFLTYMIYRGTGLDSLEAFQEVSSNVTTFTDLTPPSQKTFYQVVVSREGACQPSKKAGVNYSISKSNVVELSTVGIKDPAIDHRLTIFPNPADHTISVVISQELINDEAMISVFDMAGKQVLSSRATEHTTTLSTSRLTQGIYIIQVASGRYYGYQKIAIRH